MGEDAVVATQNSDWCRTMRALGAPTLRAPTPHHPMGQCLRRAWQGLCVLEGRPPRSRGDSRSGDLSRV